MASELGPFSIGYMVDAVDEARAFGDTKDLRWLRRMARLIAERKCGKARTQYLDLASQIDGYLLDFKGVA